MTTRTFLNGRVTLHAGDCLAVLPTLPENSVDSVCTDPPYHLTSMVKRFANAKAENEDYALNKSHSGYMSRGFMNQKWDGGDIAFRPETWAAVLRVLKPGGHMVAFAAPKNAHRMVCAIEDAGFEIRDTLMWLFGSGFPKSLDVSKAIDKAAGAEREVVGREKNWGASRLADGKTGYGDYAGDWDITAPATDAARAWEGWGTALKPAYEPICLARKPLSEPTIASNCLRWGTGALNIDGCRVEGAFESGWSKSGSKASENVAMSGANYEREPKPDSAFGRWPANCLHDGSEEVVAGFPKTISHGGGTATYGGTFGNGKAVSDATSMDRFAGDSGSAARFFYSSKADQDDRLGSKHPTVKPLDLMQYLVRLVTPPRGVVLDIFAGTGTTAEAAWREGFSAILIEREPEYLADIERRMKLCLAGPDERARESIMARLKDKPRDDGPLFGGSGEPSQWGRREVYGHFADEGPKEQAWRNLKTKDGAA